MFLSTHTVYLQGLLLCISANWYRTLIYPATAPDIMPPSDESTSLLPDARPLNWRQKCCKFSYWFCCFVYFLLLFANMVLPILADIGTFKIYNVKVIANVSALPAEDVLDLQKEFQKELEDNLVEGIVANVTDTLICWIFLGIVARSPCFVGCFTVLKNLIRLPSFWNLVFLVVLYITGAVLSLLSFFSSALRKKEKHVISGMTVMEVVAVMGIVMELLNVFTKLALVGVLNYVQVQNVARSRLNYWLLKGILLVTWFSQFCTLIGAMMALYFSFLKPIATGNSHVQEVGSSTNTITVMELFLLPFVTKTTGLIFAKTLRDKKCIIGKHERNSFTRQNPRISNPIEKII